MQVQSSQQGSSGWLSDKDLQLIRKTYSKLTEFYYENGKNQSTITDLISMGHLITQTISLPRQAEVLGVISIIESLKVKSKSRPDLLEHIESTVRHLRNPTQNSIKYQTLLYSLQRSDLFPVGCTISIRFYQKIHNSASDFNWKQILEQISRNITISPNLSIELGFFICKENQNYSRCAVKSGLIKYIFLSYINATLQNKFNLHKAIKLLKVVANADGTLLRDKEKSLALVVYTYEDYVPLIEGIIAKCYDQEYCSAIDNRKKYDQISIDRLYLWSYLELFCLNNLSESTIADLIRWLKQPLNEAVQAKIYGILSNYSKFKKIVLKEGLEIIPKSEKSLLNFIKLCVNCCELDNGSSNYISMAKLQDLVDKSPNQKVSNLFKYLKDLRNKETKIGSLNQNYKKMFNMQKNADFMMERAAKIPQNNEQLQDINQILKEKDRTNEFESDTLHTLKERALNSLHTAVMLKRKLDLNIILKQVQFGDVRLLFKLLQILELSLTINEDLVETINAKRVLEIIQWIQDHYQGESIEWGPIGQLMVMLFEEEEWKEHLKELPEKCFWLLNILVLEEDDEKLVLKRLAYFQPEIEKWKHKVPLMIGFLSRALNNEAKINLFKKYSNFFSLMLNNLKTGSGQQYKKNLTMFSLFLKNWYSQPESKIDQENNKIFQSLIEPLLKIVFSNFRSLEQEYELLERCLPFKIRYQVLKDNIDSLISQYGTLASFIFRQSQQQGEKLAIDYERLKAICYLPPEQSRKTVQILKFLEQNSDLLQADELSPMLDRLMNKKLAYWFAYPYFYTILSRLLSILSKTQNIVLQSSISNILCSLILYIIHNQDISPDEKIDLFNEIKDCLSDLADRHVPIDKQKIRKTSEKITDKEVKEEIMRILDGYQSIQPKKENQKFGMKDDNNRISNSNLTSNEQSLVKESSSNLIVDLVKNQFIQEQDKTAKQEDVDIQLQNLDRLSQTASNQQLHLLEALRTLKKIIQKKESDSKFPTLYSIFMKHTLKLQHKDVLGHLLALFYPNRPPPMQKQILQLLLNKEKTRLSKQSCYQLLRNHSETFQLSKRWKLIGQEWLDLAMLRFSEGQIADGSQVAEQNLSKASQIEYFASKGYHEIVVKNYPKIQQQQDYSYCLILIGTSSRSSQAKNKYYKQRLHLKMLQLMHKYPKNNKLFANLLYALSAMVYMQPEVCLELIKQRPELQLIFEYLKKADDRAIIQSGACLIANISYSNEEVKETLRQLNAIQNLLVLFQTVLVSPEISTFKQILRAFGNLSLSVKCSQQLIDQHFCSLAVKMTEKIDILTQFNQKKAVLIKILIDLIANLASHKYKLEVFHRQKITDTIITLLQITHTNIPILTACIDLIDCLCQCPEIQNYVVTQKKIPFLLIDILKMQTDEKIVVKSTRLLTNLTINPACIPHILKANLLSVLANIVMPHFYGNKTVAEQMKKMETYILKIITRIYHSKAEKQLILKSGYLDCLIRVIENAENIEDSYIQILYFYSEVLPNFLNKRAFLSLIKVLVKRMNSQQVVSKCISAIKRLSNFYQKVQEDVLIPGSIQLYEKLISSEFDIMYLQLLCYHLLRSGKLREALRVNKKVVELIKKVGQGNDCGQLSRQIIYLINNPYSFFQQSEQISVETEYQELKKGFKCKLFRLDGSSKKAIIDMNEQYQIRAYKFPDGQIKKKYVIDIKNLKDYQFNYPYSEELWNSTIFALDKGIFNSSKCDPKQCATIISSKKWGELNYVNVEFENVQQKLRFYQCLRAVYNSLK